MPRRAPARILREATEDANRTREQAEIDASRKRTDAAADAEGEVSLAKQQGREMVNEARAYRERVLSELTRRRELARQQIEQLILGRDRLLQVFERARLVAVDVVAELHTARRARGVRRSLADHRPGADDGARPIVDRVGRPRER